jgi:hypothetical protein
MIFTLEALQAGAGDCLVLHYGPPEKPRFLVIDGGPAGIYKNSLKARLQQLCGAFGANGKLNLELVMVSHIDDDHIHGILDWMKDIEKGKAVPCNIPTFWYNSFDDVTGTAAEEIRTRLASLAAGPGAVPVDSSADSRAGRVVAASVGQGRELRAWAAEHAIGLNMPFKGEGGKPGLVMAPLTKPVSRPGGLKLHVVGPDRQRLADLLAQWKKEVAKHPDPVVVASFVDKSVPNLSSIVVVAEFEKRRMLLTGDARGDYIRDGLRQAGFLDGQDRAHFDLIKLPHHGSDRDMDEEWLRNITADHYVISANGQHDNPDADTVEWLCRARGDASYTIHLTNRDMVNPKGKADIGAAVQAVLARNPGPGRAVNFRDPARLSVMANVLDKVTY